MTNSQENQQSGSGGFRRAQLRAMAVLAGLLAGCVLAGLMWAGFRSFAPEPAQRANDGFEALLQSLPADSRTLLHAAGYGANDRIVTTANFNGSLVFSGRVMTHDPRRGYRFHPSQHLAWVKPDGMPYQVPIPDSDKDRSIVEQLSIPVTSREYINAFGCRGPEWESPLEFELRVLVAGDSFAEGILVSVDQTFPAVLESKLESVTGKTTLVANAGVIGYSTEQEYHTIAELVPVLKPHVVVLCFYPNDVHFNHVQVLKGQAGEPGWDAARYWLGRCVQFCREQGVQFALVAIPDRSQLSTRLSRSHYQHRLERLSVELAVYMIDPHERFLSRRQEALYLYGDDHLAPRGHELLAEVLADHIKAWDWVSRDSD